MTDQHQQYQSRDNSFDIPISVPLMSSSHPHPLSPAGSFDLLENSESRLNPIRSFGIFELSKKINLFSQFFWKNLGLFLIVLSQFFNSLMVVTTKLLVKDPQFADDPIHPAQILFVRMVITTIGCYLYLKHIMKIENVLGPKEIRGWLLTRGFCGFFGVFSLYYSLMYLSVSDAVTITFLIPSVTGFLAWIVLREKWSLTEAGCGLVSLVGVLLIARPSFIFGNTVGSGGGDDQIESSDSQERLIGTLVGLIGVFGASGAYIVIRKIRGAVHSLITVQYFAMCCVFVTFISLVVVPGLSFKLPRTPKQWVLFFGLGISGFCMQFLLTEGIMREKASRASSMLYVQIIYSIFWEILIWGHVPNFSSLCGIGIILGAAFVVVYYKPSDEDSASKPVADAENQIFSEVTLSGRSVRLEDYPSSRRE